MISALWQVRPLAIALALVPSFMLGGVWFTVVVAKWYAVALGREALPKQAPTPLLILGPLGCNLVMTVTSAVLLRLLHVEAVDGALAFGALVGVGYAVAMCLTIAINPNFPRPFLYTAINAPYFVTSSVMTSVVLVALR